jgi:predicted metal-dependent hydrolase
VSAEIAPSPTPQSGGEQQDASALEADPQLAEAIALFNRAEWYGCHDLLEDLWHQNQGPDRQALQGLLQIAVAHLHLERDNLRGATVLLGEGLGRLKPYGNQALGLELGPLLAAVSQRLQALQQGLPPAEGPLPRLGAPQG